MSYIDSSTEYETSLTEFHFVPRVMFDYGTIKYGFYGFTEDMVGHLSLFGGFSINKLSDVDAMIMLEYKKLYPTLYANLFWQAVILNKTLIITPVSYTHLTLPTTPYV